MNAPTTSTATSPGAARFLAAVYTQRNLLAAVPVVMAWWAMPHGLHPSGLALGAALVSAGISLRAWATLFNRYAQGERKTLACAGPYAWLRNPLYVANTAVMLGAVAASGLGLWLPASALWCGLVYDLTVRHEESRLHEKYGAAYAAYRASVPRWLPRRLGDVPRVDARRYAAAWLRQAPLLAILLPFLVR